MVVIADAGGGGPVHTGPQPVRMAPLCCRVPHDWSRYSLEQIWGMVGRQSSVTGQASADLWASIRTLCREKATRIEQALDKLREHWPVTQESAQMFQTWGASLVAALQCTAETARLNLQVVLNIRDELASARDRVAALIERRNEYQAEEQARDPLASQYSVPLDWRPELERRAREVMADLEDKIYTYALDLHADPPYKPLLGAPIDSTGEQVGGGTSGRPGPYGGGSAVATTAWLRPHLEPGANNSLSDDDPVAGGVAMPDVGPAGGGGTVLSGGVGGGPVPVPVGQVGPGGALVEAPGGRVLGPGGVVVGPGGGHGATPGVPGAPGPGGLVVAPGVGGAGRAPGGRGMVPFVPPMMGQPGSRGRTGTSGSRREQRPGLPSVFQVPEAPPAVIRAPEEPEHDPGPGVIGIDR